MPRGKTSKSLGCVGNAVFYFFGLTFLVTIFGSIFILAPLTERAVQDNFCKSGTIQSKRWNRSRTITCIDKKTGQKSDVSITQAIGFCPTALIFVGGVIFLIILARVLPDTKTAD